jgi:baculoviral IAP repeat-containing protein 6
VIVSVQSLILCTQPYFNEPGYERMMGTPDGDKASSQYNASIQEHTLRSKP